MTDLAREGDMTKSNEVSAKLSNYLKDFLNLVINAGKNSCEHSWTVKVLLPHCSDSEVVKS